MSFEIPGFVLGTEVAAADLSTKQHFAVKIVSGGINLAGAGEAAIGILQNDPTSGQSAEVMVSGVSYAVAGGTVAKGDLIAADSAGKLVVATKATVNTSDAGGAADPVVGSHVLGIALSAAAANEKFALQLLHLGAVPTTAA